MVKFHFSHSKLRKQQFVAKHFKTQGVQDPPSPPLPTPMAAYSSVSLVRLERTDCRNCNSAVCFG